jgi:hypothetical protein
LVDCACAEVKSAAIRKRTKRFMASQALRMPE